MGTAELLLHYARQWRSAAREIVTLSIPFAQFFFAPARYWHLHLLPNNRTLLPPFANFYKVSGPSMLPTLNFSGDVLLVEKVSRFMDVIGPGDVVLVRSPENPRKTIAKRIIGVEGDKVTYLVDPGRSDLCASQVVPKGHVWIQGDNIYASRDSRHIGPVPCGLILGKAFFRVWPPEEFGPLVQ